MVQINRLLLAIALFCYWYFLSSGFEPIAGKITHIIGTVAAAWSVYNGTKWQFRMKDGEGLAWAIIGAMIFLGFTARWLVAVA